MIEDFSHVARQKDLSLEVHADIAASQVMIDGQILYRILENLFTNALRFAVSKIEITFFC